MRSFRFLCAVSLAVLAGCGGGGDVASALPQGALNAVVATPSYDRMPLSMPEPVSDRDGRGESAHQSPALLETPAEFADLSRQRLTDDDVEAHRRRHSERQGGLPIQPAATPLVSVVYTAAQIRAAYQFPDLAGSPLPSAADKGAGQTVYIINAYNHPKVVQDLNTFSTQMGLPTCKQKTLNTNATALPAPSLSQCEIYVLYGTASGGMTSRTPAYNAGWAQEIALDTQWVHAIAPLARIVLIESPTNSLADLSGAIKLANKFGKGVVSMSFGALEGSWVNNASYSSSIFNTAGMSYFAATGDSGYAVMWPAVVPTVVGVGGTTLNYAPGSRSESVWSGSGGGVSLYVPMPGYQNTSISVAGNAGFRAVSDVAMTADPYTGVYVAFTSPNARSTSWYAFGGTSLATPMWAAATALANAKRQALSKATLSAPHALLYATAGTGNYGNLFNDIQSGANGTCAICSALTGYDIPTGLGTPMAPGVLSHLAAN